MAAAGFSELTDAQRACLRLVYEHKSSKQIARALGVSKDTVDQRLDRARKLLGASSRTEAAIAFHEWEQVYHRVVYDAPSVVLSTPYSTTLPAAEDCRNRIRPGLVVNDVYEPYRTSDASNNGWLGSLLRLRLGKRNDLSLWQRTICIAAIAAAVPVVLGSLIVGLWAVGRIAAAVWN